MGYNKMNESLIVSDAFITKIKLPLYSTDNLLFQKDKV